MASFTPRPLYLLWKTHGTLSIEAAWTQEVVWALRKENNLFHVPGIELRFLCRLPVASSVYRLPYLVSLINFTHYIFQFFFRIKFVEFWICVTYPILTAQFSWLDCIVILVWKRNPGMWITHPFLCRSYGREDDICQGDRMEVKWSWPISSHALNSHMESEWTHTLSCVLLLQGTETLKLQNVGLW